jgi:hypothetical protein
MKSTLFFLEIAFHSAGIDSRLLIWGFVILQRPLLLPILSVGFPDQILFCLFTALVWNHLFLSSEANWSRSLHRPLKNVGSAVFFSRDLSVLLVPPPFIVAILFVAFILTVIHPSGNLNHRHSCRAILSQ